MQTSKWESSGGSGRQHDTWIMQMHLFQVEGNNKIKQICNEVIKPCQG